MDQLKKEMSSSNQQISGGMLVFRGVNNIKQIWATKKKTFQNINFRETGWFKGIPTKGDFLIPYTKSGKRQIATETPIKHQTFFHCSLEIAKNLVKRRLKSFRF